MVRQRLFGALPCAMLWSKDALALWNADLIKDNASAGLPGSVWPSRWGLEEPACLRSGGGDGAPNGNAGRRLGGYHSRLSLTSRGVCRHEGKIAGVCFHSPPNDLGLPPRSSGCNLEVGRNPGLAGPTGSARDCLGTKSGVVSRSDGNGRTVGGRR